MVLFTLLNHSVQDYLHKVREEQVIYVSLPTADVVEKAQ